MMVMVRVRRGGLKIDWACQYSVQSNFFSWVLFCFIKTAVIFKE